MLNIILKHIPQYYLIMTSLNIQMSQSNPVREIKKTLCDLQNKQKQGTFYRDSLLVTRTTNNINYIDELENIVDELQYLETQKCHPISKFEIPLIPVYSSVRRFATLLEIIRHQEERITNLESIINK
tara:strand:+ start:162 stop:542 length:381 start_codon:yes stop_codon:yes gene_type:complete